MPKIFSKLAVFVLVFLFVITVSPRVYASKCEELLDQGAGHVTVLLRAGPSCTLKKLNPVLAIQRTIDDSLNEMVTGFPAAATFNANPDELGVCGVYIYHQTCLEVGCDISDFYSAADVQASQEGITAGGCSWDDPVCPFCDFNSTVYGARMSGSLMGVTKVAYNIITTEPPPVSLAYYVKHNAKKIPIINQTAYAQGVSYNMWGLELVLSLWESARNLAYAMMSVIMLVVGILIITRKKINPQTMVTVQSALPRVVISLILITFSYPIGAVMASMSIPLILMVFRFFFTEMWENFADMDKVVMIITMFISVIGPQGLVGVVLGIILGILTIVAMLVAAIKIMIITTKILVNIVIAPLQFAIAAVPGQEHLVGEWFKKMIAYVLSIPAIFFMIALAWYVFLTPFMNANMFSGIVNSADPITMGFSFIRSFGSHVMTLIMLPMMCIFIMFSSIKIDKKVQEAIMGNKKRR